MTDNNTPAGAAKVNKIPGKGSDATDNQLGRVQPACTIAYCCSLRGVRAITSASENGQPVLRFLTC